jgi:hypothetical protein
VAVAVGTGVAVAGARLGKLLHALNTILPRSKLTHSGCPIFANEYFIKNLLTYYTNYGLIIKQSSPPPCEKYGCGKRREKRVHRAMNSLGVSIQKTIGLFIFIPFSM